MSENDTDDTDLPDADLHWGSALGEAVEVAVDGGGRVAAVELDPDVLGRLWPEQLGSAVVEAHASARAAAAGTGALGGGRR